MDEGIGDRTRLLVVEDEDLARIPLVRLLVVHGYSCDEATNCQEAFDLLAGSSSTWPCSVTSSYPVSPGLSWSGSWPTTTQTWQ